MAKYCSKAFVFAAVSLAVGIHFPNPGVAQNPNDTQMFRGLMQGAMSRAAQRATRHSAPKILSARKQVMKVIVIYTESPKGRLFF